METNKKLKAKDLINVGIYTAIYIVIFFVVGMLNAIPVLYPFLYVLIPLISGIPFMLFLTKTEKFGMVTIMSVICGVFWFLMGYTWTAVVGYVVFGIIADIVLKAGNYKSLGTTAQARPLLQSACADWRNRQKVRCRSGRKRLVQNSALKSATWSCRT